MGDSALSLDECIELYKNLRGEIFGKAKALNAGTMFSSVVNHVIAPDISVICGGAEEGLADGAVGDRVL